MSISSRFVGHPSTRCFTPPLRDRRLSGSISRISHKSMNSLVVSGNGTAPKKSFQYATLSHAHSASKRASIAGMVRSQSMVIPDQVFAEPLSRPPAMPSALSSRDLNASVSSGQLSGLSTLAAQVNAAAQFKLPRSLQIKRPRASAISGTRPSLFALGIVPPDPDSEPSSTIPASISCGELFASSTSASLCSPAQPESPLARARRSAPPASVPTPRHIPTETSYKVEIDLPRPGGRPFAPEMITISVLKGDQIKIVADAWDQECDCHFEWCLEFPPRAVNMSSMQAKIDVDGNLIVDLKRSMHYATNSF